LNQRTDKEEGKYHRKNWGVERNVGSDLSGAGGHILLRRIFIEAKKPPVRVGRVKGREFFRTGKDSDKKRKRRGLVRGLGANSCGAKGSPETDQRILQERDSGRGGGKGQERKDSERRSGPRLIVPGGS